MKEVYLDTNIILRSILRDNEALYQKSVNSVRNYIDKGYTLKTTDLVIAEVFYVAASVKTHIKKDRREICSLLENFILITDLQFPSLYLWSEISDLYQNTSVDFEDVHLFLEAKEQGAQILTLDRDFARLKKRG